MVSDGKPSVGMAPPEKCIFGMLSVTVTFEPMNSECHQRHKDLVMSNCDKFH